MNVRSEYHCKSMSDLAEYLEEMGRGFDESAPHQGTKVKQAYDRGKAEGFSIAASIVRGTKIVTETEHGETQTMP